MYNADQKSVIKAFKQQAQTDKEALHLFFVNNVGGKAGVTGYMPRQYQYGLIYNTQDSKTIAHELGHGAFNLEHITISDNLMNTGGANGTSLLAPQWKQINDPGNLIFKFLQDEEGAELLEGVTQSIAIDETVVPIVTGERRKARQEQQTAKKKYKKKPTGAPRLCADDLASREKLKHYQDTYAEAMNRYGLQRGVDGSAARHISTQQFYRDLSVKNENLKETVEVLQEEKEEVYEKLRDMYDRKDGARDRFLDMDRHLHEKERELDTLETKLQKAKQNYEPYKAQDELNLIHGIFPMMKENLRIAEFCKKIGLAVESIKSLFEGKTLTVKTFSFFSPEHNQKFTAENVKLKIEREQYNPEKLRLNLNGMNILEWFRQKYNDMQQARGLQKKNKGLKL